jgi:ribosome biogenesis GTPase
MKALTGLVYKSTGSWYIVYDEEGKQWNARIKGKLKIDKDISSTNPIAVGDKVLFEEEAEDGNIGTIKPETYSSRQPGCRIGNGYYCRTPYITGVY